MRNFWNKRFLNFYQFSYYCSYNIYEITKLPLIFSQQFSYFLLQFYSHQILKFSANHRRSTIILFGSSFPSASILLLDYTLRRRLPPAIMHPTGLKRKHIRPRRTENLENAVDLAVVVRSSTVASSAWNTDGSPLLPAPSSSPYSPAITFRLCPSNPEAAVGRAQGFCWICQVVAWLLLCVIRAAGFLLQQSYQFLSCRCCCCCRCVT